LTITEMEIGVGLLALAGHTDLAKQYAKEKGVEMAVDAAADLVGAAVGGLLAKAAAALGGAAEGAGSGARSLGARAARALVGVCLVAGTLVATPRGAMAIETLAPGDQVLAREEATGKQEYKRVVRTFVTKDQPVVTLSVRDAKGKASEITATPGHPFWVVDEGWVGAGELVAGDRVTTDTAEVLEVEGSAEAPRATVYLEVADFNTYFAGPGRAWVHNNGCAKGATAAAGGGTAARAGALREAIPAGSRGRITMGVGVAEDASGARQVLVGTSEPRGYLRPGVTLAPGEMIAPGLGHAEADIVNYAQQNGLRLLEVGATRPICPACAAAIEGAGARAVTPLKVP
jgi:hypothetical protein